MSQEQATPASQQAALDSKKELTTEKEIVDAYNAHRSQQSQYMQRISEFEGEMHENVLVLEALKPLPAERRAHRQVGGALIEKTVGEIRPEVEQLLSNLAQGVKQLQEMLVAKEKELEDFMIKYKITRRPNAGSSEEVIARNGGDGAKQLGVLA